MKNDLLAYRHIGISEKDEEKMLQKIGVKSLDAVSYTHLDVYKRQVWKSFSPFSKRMLLFIFLTQFSHFICATLNTAVRMSFAIAAVVQNLSLIHI